MTGRNLPKVGSVLVMTEFDAITVVADPAAPVQTDGELLGTASEITLRPVPDGVKVLAPPEA
jgi:diacylglycerol kinase family enzyme